MIKLLNFLKRKKDVFKCDNCGAKTEDLFLLQGEETFETVVLCDKCKAEFLSLICEYAFAKGGYFERILTVLYQKYLQNDIGNYILETKNAKEFFMTSNGTSITKISYPVFVSSYEETPKITCELEERLVGVQSFGYIPLEKIEEAAWQQLALKTGQELINFMIANNSTSNDPLRNGYIVTVDKRKDKDCINYNTKYFLDVKLWKVKI